MTSGRLLFKATTPMAFSVEVSRERWNLIVSVKHPVMNGREADVQAALERPDEVRRSRRDAEVLLFYRLERPGRWTRGHQTHRYGRTAGDGLSCRRSERR